MIFNKKKKFLRNCSYYLKFQLLIFVYLIVNLILYISPMIFLIVKYAYNNRDNN